MDPPVGPDAMKRDLARLEQFHDEWTRRVQQVRRLLSGEVNLDGGDRDSVTLRKLVNYGG